MAKFAHRWAKDHPSVDISNRGGYQSAPLPLDVPELQSLRREANKYFNEFIKVFYYNRKLKISNMWININHPKNYNSRHNHPFSSLSSCFYISVPQKSGNLIFHNEMPIEGYLHRHHFSEYGWYNASEWTMVPKENYFYVFPPWLQHSVQQNNSSKDRISISINAREEEDVY